MMRPILFAAVLALSGCGAAAVLGPAAYTATGEACLVAENKVADAPTLEADTKTAIVGVIRELCDAIKAAIRAADAQ